MLQQDTLPLQGKRFVLDLAVYVYDQASETFERLPDMPTDLPNQILRANEALQEINAGNRSATWCSVYLPCVLQRHAPLNNTFLLTRICLGSTSVLGSMSILWLA